MGRIFDSERVKRRITEQLSTLTKKHPEAQNDIELAQATINNEMEKETRHITIPPFIRQKFLYSMAGHYVYRDERRDWHFYNAIISIITIDEIDSIIKRKYGTNYEELQRRLNRYGNTLGILRQHLDQLQLNPKNTKKYLYHIQKTREYQKQIPSINQDLNRLFHIICLYTNLGQFTVPNQPIQIFRHEYKKIEYPDEKKKNPEQNRTTETEGGET